MTSCSFWAECKCPQAARLWKRKQQVPSLLQNTQVQTVTEVTFQAAACNDATVTVGHYCSSHKKYWLILNTSTYLCIHAAVRVPNKICQHYSSVCISTVLCSALCFFRNGTTVRRMIGYFTVSEASGTPNWGMVSGGGREEKSSLPKY